MIIHEQVRNQKSGEVPRQDLSPARQQGKKKAGLSQQRTCWVFSGIPGEQKSYMDKTYRTGSCGPQQACVQSCHPVWNSR